MFIPQAKILLPELDDFALYLLEQCQNHQIDDWSLFTEQVRGFYTSPMMDKFERVIPGWIKMSSYTDQQTLIHVTSVLTALFALPEFKQAPPDQQSQMIWVVLFHDVAKVAELRKHDYVHAFRSAAIAGKALAGLGFPVTTN